MWRSKNKKPFFSDFEMHSQEIRKAAIALKQLFDGSIPKEEASLLVKKFEHEADTITHNVIRQLCVANFIPPLDHQDILCFIYALDDVIDYIDDSVEAFVEIFELDLATSYAKNFAEEILKGSNMLVNLCPLLRLPARNSVSIQNICTQIHQIEGNGDNIKREALKDLFRNYTGAKSDVAWDRIYTFLEMATDKVEDCANIAEQILMKYS